MGGARPEHVPSELLSTVGVIGNLDRSTWFCRRKPEGNRAGRPRSSDPEVLKKVMQHMPLGVLPEVEDIVAAIPVPAQRSAWARSARPAHVPTAR